MTSSLLQNYTLVVGVLLSSDTLKNINDCAYDSRMLLPTKSCAFPGLYVESIAMQLRNANVKYIVQPIVPVIIKGSSMKTRYEMMLNGSVDMFATNHWFITNERRQMGFQFSIPTDTSAAYSALVKKVDGTLYVDMMQSIQAYTTQIFHPTVLLYISLLYLVRWLYELLLPSMRSGRVMSQLLCLCAAAGLGFYGTGLLVNILMHTKHAPFHDFESMLEALSGRKVHLTKTHNIGWYPQFVNHTDIIYSRTFVAATKSNPPIIGGRRHIDRLIDEGRGHFEIKTSNVAKWKAAVKCDLVAFEMPEFGPLLIGIMFSPKTPLKIINAINKGISLSYGYKMHLYDKYMSEARQRARVSCPPSHTDPTIDINSVTILFVALAACYGIISLCFVAEKFYGIIVDDSIRSGHNRVSPIGGSGQGRSINV